MATSKRSGLTELESLFTMDPVLGGVLEGRYQKLIDTPGTGRGMAITTAFSATSAVVLWEAVGLYGRIVRPHFIRMVCTVAPASATSTEIAIAVDPIARFSSGGVPLVNNATQPNTAYPRAPDLGADFGMNRVQVASAAANVTLVAEGAAVRRIARATVKTGILAVGDEIFIDFLSNAGASGARGTGSSYYIPVGPAVLMPPSGSTHSLCLHMWHPGNAVTGASFEFQEMGWFEMKSPQL